jgi:hypothetical protein
MAKYEVEAPDGGKYEVEMPDGLSPEAMRSKLEETFTALGIKANRVDSTAGKFAAPAVAPKYPGLDFSQPVPQVRAAIQAMPETDRKGAFNEWAKQYVAKERAGGGIMQGVRDFGRNLARGTPVGSWLDEANAKTANLVSGTPYDEALAYQRATDEAIDKDSTKLTTLPLIGDVTAGGVQKVAGGVLSAPVSPMVNLMRGGTMLPRVVNSAATGAAYGAGYGAGEGDTSGERMVNAGVGAGIGLGLGAAMPPIAEGLGRMVKRQAQPQGPLANMNREAVANVADDMRADRVSQIVPDGMLPEAMLADLGPNLQGHAGAIARRPGEGQTIVKDALGATVGEGRRGGAAQRITGAVDEALGPAQNLVQLEDQILNQSRAAARPYYERFENTPVQPTPRLQQLLTFAEQEGVTRAADDAMRREAALTGQPASANMLLEFIKREFDRRARHSNTPTGGLDAHTAGQYRQLAAVFREEVDNILMAQDAATRGVRPEQGVSSWQQARGLAGTGLQFREGLEQGADAFKRGTHPDQMRADLAGMESGVQRSAYDQGARGAIRDIMGNQGTMFGPTGDSAAMKTFGNEYARDKLRQVAGDQGADTILGRLGAEARYEQTRQAAVGNSVTTAMQQAMKRFDKTSAVDTALDPTVGMLGTVKQFARWSINKMTAGYLDERSRAVAVDAARILTAQGPERDAYIRELTSFINRRDVTARQRGAATALLESIGVGARAPAIESAAIGGEQRP